MANKQLYELTDIGSPGLSGDMIMYLVDADGSPEGDSRKVTLDELKTFINTDPTVVPSSVPWRGARVYRTTNLTGIPTGTAITWQASAIDTESIWSVGAPTRLTVPTGVTKVRLFGGAQFETGGTAGTVGLSINKGGSAMGAPNHYGRDTFRSGTTGFTTNRAHIFTSVLEVTAGQYFELLAQISMTGIDEVLASEATFFEMEILEATI